jgi:hypothetical protein
VSLSDQIVVYLEPDGRLRISSPSLSIKAGPEPLPYGADRSYLQAGQPVGPSVGLCVAMLVLHRL